MKKFYDTNALLELQDIVFDDYFFISSKTLEEIENIKISSNKDADVKYKARHIANLLYDNRDKFGVIFNSNEITEMVYQSDLVESPDATITACAKYVNDDIENITFVTNDINCALIAEKIFRLNVEKATNNRSFEYTGFKIVTPTDEELASVYSKDNCENIFNLKINEYAIINDDEGNFCDAVKWNGICYQNIFNKNLKTMAFGDKLKAKDIYQRLAIDSLVTNTMTCISGHAGSGKSLLSLMAAMYLIENGKYDRITILFNPCSVRGASQMGYYTGSVIEKALQGSIGHILTTKFGDKFAVDNYIAQGKIKLVPMADCRGMEITDNEILWITEAENTTIDLIKICLSRVSSGAKVFIEGDFDQTDNKMFDINNGMARAIQVLAGEKEFGYVQLQNVWRSRIAELTDKF